jgi:NADH-quinone oxidoreductase subunit N
MLLLMRANELISMYLSLELQSLTFYVLASYRRTSIYGTESGLKYYVMGSFSSCILLLGISFVYGITGLTNIEDISLLDLNNLSYKIALQLVIIGFLFKLSAFPFHM